VSCVVYHPFLQFNGSALHTLSHLT